MGLEKDLPPGEQLLALFRPFLEHLAASELTPKTIQKHVDNMWALGGEFIRDLNYDPPLRKRPVEQHLLKMIEYGGPLLYHGGEDQQRSFDSTCRKFRRFLTEAAHFGGSVEGGLLFFVRVAQARSSVADHFLQYALDRPLPQWGVVVQFGDELAAEYPHVVHMFLDGPVRHSRSRQRFEEWPEAFHQPFAGRDVLIHSHP
jgi:hypothetical protein